MVSRVLVLGATGSIGDSTLEVLRLHPGKFGLHTVTAHQNVEKLFEICVEFHPQKAIVTREQSAERLRQKLLSAGCQTEVECGSVAINEAVQQPDVDCVVTGIVGAAGLLPTLSAVRSRAPS